LGTNDADFNTRLGVIEPVNRAFSWGIGGSLSVANNQGMKYAAPLAMTPVEIMAFTSSGRSVDIRITKNGASLATLADIGTTVVHSALTELAIAQYDKIAFDITDAGSSAIDIWALLECTVP
jgi:hypothetical protein